MKKTKYKGINKFIKISLVALVSMAGVLSLSAYMFANEETTHQMTNDELITMDMIAYPKYPKGTDDYRAPMETYNDSIADVINQQSQYYKSEYRQYICNIFPEADIQKIDAFVESIDGYNKDVKNTFEKFQTTYEKQGYIDAYLLSEELTAAYNYNSTKYNYIASFINTYGEQYDEEINTFLLSFLDESISYVGFIGYYELDYMLGDDYENQKKLISNLYDEVHQQVSYGKTDADEINKMTADILQKSIMDWVYEVDIDYFKAYQAQIKLYLQNAKELSYVYDIDNDTIDFSWNVTNGRSLVLKDLLINTYVFESLFPEFLAANLNSDGTALISPEDVYKTDFIQNIIKQSITSVLTPQTSSEQDEFYKKENYVETLYSAIEVQYAEIGMPGSSAQPILQVYNSYFVDMAKEGYYQENHKLPILTTWIPQGQTKTEYDQYRLLNYSKVPMVAIKEKHTKAVSRAIQYTFEDGTSASQDVIQSAIFTTTKELISGKESGDVGMQTLPSLENPVVDYAQSDVRVLPAKTDVKEVQVTKDSTNIIETIVYPLEFTLQVAYLDEEGNTIKDSKNIVGRWNTKYSENAITIDGYELLQTPSNSTGVFGIDREAITFVYKVVEKDKEGTGGQLKLPNAKSDNNSNKIVKTKDVTNGDTWKIWIGFSLLVMGYLIRKKLVNHK